MDEQLKHDLQKLIEYQKKDIELHKLNSLLDRDSAIAEMNKHKKIFNDAKQTLGNCEQQASAVVTSYYELQKYVQDNEPLFAELESKEAGSEEELAERVKKLDSLKGKFQAADKKAHDLDDRTKDIYRSRSDAMRSGKAAQQQYLEAKKKHDALVKSKSDELNKLKKELDDMAKGLNQKMLAEYNKLVAENKFPPIAPASGDEKKGMFNCGGCGLDLSQQSNTLLRDQGWCHCDTCHRIVYKLN